MSNYNQDPYHGDQNPYRQPQAQQHPGMFGQTSMPYNPYAAANAEQVERLGFIRRTYLHLGAAVLAFALLEWLLLAVFREQVVGLIRNVNPMMFLIIFFGFIGVGWVARYWASSSTSKAVQYAGLSLYVVAEAIFFLPLLAYATMVPQFEGIVPAAGIITGIVFVGLTVAVFVSRIDFSFLRMFLIVGSLAAFAFIIASFFFGGSGLLGPFFACAMIVLACGYILYDTSNVMHHYRTDQHVAAALALFASVAILFWYVIRLLMALRR